MTFGTEKPLNCFY